MRRRAIWLESRPGSTTHGFVLSLSPSILRTFGHVQLTAACVIQGCVKSNKRGDQQVGVMLLSDIFRTSPERRRECLYYLALGNYKLGNYGEARRYNDLLLDKEPANLQASNLRALIDDKVAKEGLMGVAIISGVAVAAGVVGGILLRNLGKKR